jgi:uncharacterized protein YcbX
MKITSLHIYPIKSLKGISVPELNLTFSGIPGDREMMLIDKNGDFLTQRQIGKLAQFETSIVNGLIQVKFENQKMTIHPEFGDLLDTKIWNDDITVYHVDDDADEFFSDHLGQTVFLAGYSAQHPPNKKASNNKTYQTQFSDGGQVHLVNLKSLEALNQTLESPIGIERFRANIVIDSNNPWIEESFQKIKIDKAILDFDKNTVRCKVVTLNPLSGDSDNTNALTNLKTVKGPRKFAEFGVHLIVSHPEKVKIGDEILMASQTNNFKQ